MNRFIYLAVFYCIFIFFCNAQDNNGEKTIILDARGDTVDTSDDTDIENLIETTSEDAEDSQLLDRLQKLEQNPVDLNTATSDDLQQIPFIDAVMARNILEYKIKYGGKFASIYELNYVQGMDEELYNKIKMFVVVRSSKIDFRKDDFGVIQNIRNQNISKNFRFGLRSRFINDLQPSAGFLDTTYTGTRPKIYNKFEGLYSKSGYTFAGGLLLEKDAGESKLTDFVSGYFEVKTPFFVKQVIAGDYTLEFGQGITLWSSQSYSKGVEAVSSVKKKGDDIDSYGSVNEVQFYRGAAAKLQFNSSIGDFSLFGFYSNNNIDVSIDTTLDEYSTIYDDGYHRTLSEQNRNNSGREVLFGGRVLYETKFPATTKIGLTYYRSEYDKEFKYKNMFDFSGKTSNALGADYDIVIKNMNFFGEWARSYNDIVGGLSGVKILFFKTADVVFMVRNYPKNFIMLHSYGFGEQSGATQNEFGIYSGIRVKAGKLAVFNAYFDQFKFNYATFYNPVPTSGKDFMLYSEWNVTRNLKLFTKYKNETKEDVITITEPGGLESDIIYNRNQVNYRLQFDYDIFRTFRLRSRFEYVYVNYDAYRTSEKGILFFSDFNVRPLKGLSLNGRFAVFQTDSYDSRIYEYENEIYGVVSNQGLYGTGWRWYLLLKYKPYYFLELSAKYSETIIEGAKSIGSGNDEVLGDLKNRLSLQVEIKF